MKAVSKLTFVTHLQCSSCGEHYNLRERQHFATCCNKPLLVRYKIPTGFTPDQFTGDSQSMWHYREMLPVLDEKNIVSLGEGMTPILPLQKLRNKYDIPQLFMKDESNNPTGSFKARGLSAAISKAKELGIERCIIPTAGNAGGAMSAYCASAGIESIVVMPRHTPKPFKDECELFGAQLILVDGLISDCAKKVASLKKETNSFDISTLKEPYRIEGKKTMGYEIFEQFNGELPDVILYQTGVGTGLIGIWKAFHEMIQMGWIKGKLPRMIAVQAKNCQPIIATWTGLQTSCVDYVGSPSIANGLAVPHPFGEALILKTLRESRGLPIAISDEDMLKSLREISREEGFLIAPEGASLWKATLELIDKGFIERNEKILLLNTGSGYKYLENLT
jgi:threonine synthase